MEINFTLNKMRYGSLRGSYGVFRVKLAGKIIVEARADLGFQVRGAEV